MRLGTVLGVVGVTNVGGVQVESLLVERRLLADFVLHDSRWRVDLFERDGLRGVRVFATDDDAPGSAIVELEGEGVGEDSEVASWLVNPRWRVVTASLPEGVLVAASDVTPGAVQASRDDRWFSFTGRVASAVVELAADVWPAMMTPGWELVQVRTGDQGMECVCGNLMEDEGFFPCVGNELVDDGPGDPWGGRQLCCMACLRVFNYRTGVVLAQWSMVVNRSQRLLSFDEPEVFYRSAD